MDKNLSNSHEVGIVIVSMNNLVVLSNCLESIIKYTKIPYTIYVVAYLYSKENLELLYHKFPDIYIIVSNEIRGFSENNNLALSKVQEEYCLVLNDDTFIKEDIIGELSSNLSTLPHNTAAISPDIRYPDGRNQLCGRPKYTFVSFIFSLFHLDYSSILYRKYINRKGIFQTYNLSGACFLIKTDIFKKMGFFNEDYFFCPEDIELGTLLNKKGYKNYVNSNLILYHIHGKSSNHIMQLATIPATYQGMYRFFSQDKFFRRVLLGIIIKFTSFIKYIGYKIMSHNKYDEYWCRAKSQMNTFRIIGSNMSTKSIFKKYYEEILLIRKNQK